MLRKQVLEEVESLMNTYCNECFLKKQLKKDYGKRYAHQFCINNCTVGEQIKVCGEKLLSQK
ncbi:zinc-finger domain-containing protein [Mesobacillus maritimus]|uniref:zinc-finger domain-containing protein n=1 Tax=Mesobacillus maritimus TaxID=1643336 RepID=UPI0025599F9E|nr:zinc-finger domain-containing protein [Mesobacillus maritimus]